MAPQNLELFECFILNCILFLVDFTFLQDRNNLPVDVKSAQFTVRQERQNSTCYGNANQKGLMNYDRNPQCSTAAWHLCGNFIFFVFFSSSSDFKML